MNEVMNGKAEPEIKKRNKKKTKETKDDRGETIKRQRKALAFVFFFYSILHVSCRQHFVLVSLGTVSFQLTDDVGSIIDKSV